MTVLHIINEKGREVVTVDPERSVADVVAVLAGKRIGAVVVTDGGALRGILSERDIIRVLSVHGTDALGKTAGDCMTAKVVTCTTSDTIDHVMQKMTAGRFRHLPVVENGALVGIVSIGDVVKRRIHDVEREASQIRDYIATA